MIKKKNKKKTDVPNFVIIGKSITFNHIHLQLLLWFITPLINYTRN